MAVQRAYWWTFLLYEDSTPKSWLSILESSGAQICYIKHDQDTWDKDVIDGENIKYAKGDPKKPHYHVLLRWDNAKSWRQMYNYFRILGTSHFEIVKTPKHAFLYLTHETDDARKHHKHLYAVSDIQYINSSQENFESFARISGKSCDTGDLVELFELIRSNLFFEICDLIDFLLDNGRMDLIEICSGKQGFCIQSYITSFRHKISDNAVSRPKVSLLDNNRVSGDDI